MFAYCGNNPAIYKDSGGQYAESALDIVSIGLDIADIAANPTNILSWGALAADIACLILPGATGGGSIVRVVASYDKLSDVLKHGDDIIDAGKAIVSSLDNGRNMHSLYRPVIESADSFVNKALKTAFGDVDSLLRPDGINKISQIIYELKPCNPKSLKQAVNQVKKYIEMLDEPNEWLAIIDLYF